MSAAGPEVAAGGADAKNGVTGDERAGLSAARGVLAFAPLCVVAAAHWAELLARPPVGRVAAVVGVAIVCGLVLALSAKLEPYGRLDVRAIRVVAVAASLFVGLLAVGIPPELLSPTGWGDLAAGLQSGSGDLPERWPYGGDDVWVRRTVLGAIPAMVVPAAAFALWPAAAGPGGREALAVRRAGALALLLSLIGFAGAERPLPDPVLRGAVLLLALVAWLYVPRVRAHPTAALAACVTVLAAGLVSLPVVNAIDPGPPEAQRPPPRSERPSADTPRERNPSQRPRGAQRRERQRQAAAARRRRQQTESKDGAGQGQPEQSPPVLLLLIAALVVAAATFLVVRRARRRAGPRPSVEDEADELRAALERLGWSVPANTTLTELEGLLDAGAGPAAARYARRLRERRFATPSDERSATLDRRGLRRALTAGRGPAVAVRALIALPPAALASRR